MKYMFLLYGDEDHFDALSDAERGEVIDAHVKYGAALREAGAMIGGNPLANPREGKAVRPHDDGLIVEDGPFTDTKERIGGYYLIEAEDLDAALDWAARCPAAETGKVEVRPVWNIG